MEEPTKGLETAKLRIAFVSTMGGQAWGGSEELWSQAALKLSQLGHAVEASVFSWPQMPEPLTKLASSSIKISFRPRTKAPITRVLNAFLQRAFPGSLDVSERAWLKKQKPNLVVISQGGPWEGVAWMLTCRELGLPCCSIVQANSELWWPGNGNFDEIQQAISSAQRIFFVSHANHLLMEKQCAMRLPNAEVIFNPWNVPLDTVPSWPGDGGETHLACVARLEPRAKGQDILLEVFASPKWRARPICLNFYGSGPGEKPLHALKSFLKLGQVFFHGQVSDVSAIWAANHGLILASRYEGLPLAMVEAMLSARPVIATDVAGNTELVRDGINGFVAEAPTPGLLDKAMERAWARRNEWSEIGLKARTDALKTVPADPVGQFAAKLLTIAGN